MPRGLETRLSHHPLLSPMRGDLSQHRRVTPGQPRARKAKEKFVMEPRPWREEQAYRGQQRREGLERREYPEKR